MEQVKLYSLSDTIRETEDTFGTFSDKEPDLVPIGIEAVDEAIGGASPGSLVCIGAGTGVGKSRVMLSCVDRLQALGVKAGVQSNEDPADMFGSRLLARRAGIDSAKIRKKSFTAEELKLLKAGRAQLEEEAAEEAAFLTSFCISGSLKRTEAGIRALGQAGCRIIFMDYLQKLKGSSGDRRYDIGTMLGILHGAAAETNSTLVLLSQVSRQMEPGKIPSRFALKESGDIENESRIIVMLGKGEHGGVLGRLDKSSYGGEGTMLKWDMGPCGTLFEKDYYDDEDF